MIFAGVIGATFVFYLEFVTPTRISAKKRDHEDA
jgi:ABC-type branched-subunit amino acid transport system permease subunit